MKNATAKNKSSGPSKDTKPVPRWKTSAVKWGISSGTFYNWRSKYAGLELNEAKRLKELESENNKLKKLLVGKLLEVEAVKDVLSKKC